MLIVAIRRGVPPPGAGLSSGSTSITNRGESSPVPTLGFPHMRTLVLLRHGESEWNAKGLFTGWVDVGLSAAGAQEAANGGKLLARSGLKPSAVHTSVLTWAIQTALCDDGLVMLVANGNALRALLTDVEGIGDEDIAALNMPCASTMVCKGDAVLRPATGGGGYRGPGAAAEADEAVRTQGG